MQQRIPKRVKSLNIDFHRSHPAKMEQKHNDKLREFVARSGGSKGEGLLAEMNKLMEYLFEHNLAYRTTVRCSVVGVHPQNRDGMGVSCHHVGELIKSIHSTCFWSRCCQAPKKLRQRSSSMKG